MARSAITCRCHSKVSAALSVRCRHERRKLYPKVVQRRGAAQYSGGLYSKLEEFAGLTSKGGHNPHAVRRLTNSLEVALSVDDCHCRCAPDNIILIYLPNIGRS